MGYFDKDKKPLTKEEASISARQWLASAYGIDVSAFKDWDDEEVFDTLNDITTGKIKLSDINHFEEPYSMSEEDKTLEKGNVKIDNKNKFNPYDPNTKFNVEDVTSPLGTAGGGFNYTKNILSKPWKNEQQRWNEISPKEEFDEPKNGIINFKNKF